MKRDLTKNLQIARSFLNTYFQAGRECFAKGIEEYARQVVRTFPSDDYQVNLRLLTIVSGILMILHGDRPETLFRRQILLTERFLSTANPDHKLAAFRDDLLNYLEAFSREHPDDALSDRILRYLKTCPPDELRQLNVEGLAQRFRYHRNSISRKFSEERQCSLHDAIIEEKLSRAHFLLTQADAKVTARELAETFGFSDAGHFSRQFERRFGVKPAAMGEKRESAEEKDQFLPPAPE